MRRCALAFLLACGVMTAPPAAQAHLGAEVDEKVVDVRLVNGQRVEVIEHQDPLQSLAQRQLVASPAQQVRRGSAAGVPWCGPRSTTDSRVNQADPRAARIKVIYAYTNDRPDASATMGPLLQEAVGSISQSFLRRHSGGQRQMNIDMGTTCGAQYIDLLTIALPGPTGAYVNGGNVNLQALHDIAVAANGRSEGPRNYIYFLDTATNVTGVNGLAWLNRADSPDASNANNAGDLVGAVFARDLPQTPAGQLAFVGLHEITHMLGGVQLSAPHATSYGHCWDEADLMCYDDGGSPQPMNTICGFDDAFDPIMNETFDCGRDDYFNPSPAPGSYLDTHWNVFDSAFLYPAVTPPVPPTPPISPKSVTNTKKAALRALRRGKPAGRSRSTLKLSATRNAVKDLRATVIGSRVKLSRGRYLLKSCVTVTAGKRTKSSRCKQSKVTVRKTKRVGVPKVLLAAKAATVASKLTGATAVNGKVTVQRYRGKRRQLFLTSATKSKRKQLTVRMP